MLNLKIIIIKPLMDYCHLPVGKEVGKFLVFSTVNVKLKLN